jgi:hypothetical protein
VKKFENIFMNWFNNRNKHCFEGINLVPCMNAIVPSHLGIKIAIAKLKKCKSLCSDQIAAELIQAGGETLVSVIHRLVNSIWNKEALPDQWKESVIVSVYKKGVKTDFSNYHGTSLLSTLYKMFSNVLLSRICRCID